MDPEWRCIFYWKWGYSIAMLILPEGRCISYWRSFNISIKNLSLPKGSFFRFSWFLSGKTVIFHGYVCWSVIFRWWLITSKRSLVPQNYRRISEMVQMKSCHGSFFICMFRYKRITIYFLLFCLCLASFHPSLHPYTAAQQPRTSLQNK